MSKTKWMEFGAYLIGRHPDPEQLLSDLGLRKLLMLVSQTLARTHTYKDFKEYGWDTKWAIIRKTMFSQDEVPPSAKEFCQLLRIVRALDSDTGGSKIPSISSG